MVEWWRLPANELDTSNVWIKWAFLACFFVCFFLLAFWTSIFAEFWTWEFEFIACLSILLGSSDTLNLNVFRGSHWWRDMILCTKIQSVYIEYIMLQIISIRLFDSMLLSFWCCTKSVKTFGSYRHRNLESREKKSKICFFLLHSIVLNVNFLRRNNK